MNNPSPHIPTGCPVFDLVGNSDYGCPGLPRGRALHLFGGPSSGKTTLALMAAAAVCKTGGTVMYIDHMDGLSPDWLEFLGVPHDSSRFALFQPVTQEEGINLALTGIAAGVDLVVVDAVCEPEKWAVALHPMMEQASLSGTVVLGLDYEKEGVPGGGLAWKYVPSRRIRVELQGLTHIEYQVVKDLLDTTAQTTGTFKLPGGDS